MDTDTRSKQQQSWGKLEHYRSEENVENALGDADMDFLDVITFVLDRGTNSDFTMFFLITWGLCFRCNKMQMEKNLIQPSQVINHALSLHKSFNDLRSSSTQIAKRMCYWEPPPRGFLKLNVDGAMFLNLRKAGVGVVVRDNKGKLVMAASKMGNEVDDPTTIELMALLRGLQLCVHLGFSKIVVESDCMLMVQELKDDQDSFSTNVNLIKEAKSLLQHFQEVEIQHVHCMGNEVAHRLACYSWNVDNISMW
ncbi:hypothetical protein F2P56_030930 [Juglans regia]|uniref:RNase H type-1 domain-containing protein n=1 Tax=Juglans regia TaxID=51240 RepID=A0A833WZT9_JUGRE|nr:hypothetical protein F2P56_030930 [Juglans regia]